MMHAFAIRGFRLVLCVLLVGGVSGPARGAQQPEVRPDVVYYPTPGPVVEAILKLARVTSSDVVYDLGSGDGRIPILAAQLYGARGVGIDIDPRRIQEATANAQRGGVADKVTFLNQDLFTANISEATVVTLYLLPSLNTKLLPKLNRELKPGTRIVSHEFEMRDLDGFEYLPDQKVTVGRNSVVYLWTAPLKRGGE
jgi:SAM-dependent methyltransferase